MSKPLYVFDMDETLINADCTMLWNQFMVEKGIANQPEFIKRDQRLMRLYAEGNMNMDDYLAFSMAPVAMMPIEQVNTLVEECVESRILAKQFRQSKTLIEQLLRDGVEIMIISASVTFLVEAVARRLGITTALGIDLVTKFNRYTAEVKGIPSYREGKVTRLKQWLEMQPESFSEIHFYTDSINDLSLCEYADFAYLVNPCRRLKEHADRPNWTVLNWD